MRTNGVKNIPLNIDKFNKNNFKKINSDLKKTANSEIPKNIKINGTNQTESNKNTTSQNKIKKKVSFIDQLPTKKDIAQIIFINDKVSLNEDKVDTNKYLAFLRRQSTYISERNKKDYNDNNNKNNEETYKIKRPKKSLFNKREGEDKVNEQCTCACIIF